MVCELRDQHVGQKARARDTLVDNLRRDGGLYKRLAAPAYPLAPNVAFHLEGSGLVVKPLADLLPDALELTSTQTHGAVWLMSNISSRQMRWQCCAARCRLRRHRTRSLQPLKLALDRFQIRIDRLLKETALRRVQPLAAPAKLPAL